MRINTTRERLAKGEVVYGCGLQVYRAPEIPRAFAAAGFDYVFIDMEHGSFNLETAHDMIIACKLAGITPIVRVGEVQYTLCARLLDQGAQGIILPRVEDPKVLEEALSWMRFPPLGIRGFGINPTMVDYEARSMAEIIEHQNRETLSVVQFETVRAVERADELLSLKGLDVVMIGPADLSISLGIPGQFDNPLLIQTVDKVIEVQRARRGAGHPDARRRHGQNVGGARHALRGRGGGARLPAGEVQGSHRGAAPAKAAK